MYSQNRTDEVMEMEESRENKVVLTAVPTSAESKVNKCLHVTFYGSPMPSGCTRPTNEYGGIIGGYFEIDPSEIYKTIS